MKCQPWTVFKYYDLGFAELCITRLQPGQVMWLMSTVLSKAGGSSSLVLCIKKPQNKTKNKPPSPKGVRVLTWPFCVFHRESVQGIPTRTDSKAETLWDHSAASAQWTRLETRRPSETPGEEEQRRNTSEKWLNMFFSKQHIDPFF